MPSSSTVHKWPNATIPYEFDINLCIILKLTLKLYHLNSLHYVFNDKNQQPKINGLKLKGPWKHFTTTPAFVLSHTPMKLITLT